jgi:hypothetical protein
MRVRAASILHTESIERERNGRGLRLRLLAFVLAAALTWYSINPAPGPIIRRRPSEEEPPDEKRRELEPQPHRASHAHYSPGAMHDKEVLSASIISGDDEADDFDWPEYIDG